MLGYKIDYDKIKATLKWTHKGCFMALLDRTGLEGCKPKYTPAEANIKLHVNWCPDPDTAEGKAKLEWLKLQDYANRVGSSVWLGRGSKTEICWTAGMIMRFLTKPSKRHYEMTTRLIKYLSTTRDRGVVYRRQEGLLLLEYYVGGDWLTDYGNDSDNRKCRTGYAVLLCALLFLGGHSNNREWLGRRRRNNAYS